MIERQSRTDAPTPRRLFNRLFNARRARPRSGDREVLRRFAGARAVIFRPALAASLLLASALYAAAQSPRVATVEGQAVVTDSAEDSVPSNSTVRGRAVFEESGRPVRRARVVLFVGGEAAGAGAGKMVVTNARGEFEIRGVRAGKYFVAVYAPGVPAPLGFVSRSEAGQPRASRDLTELEKYFDEVAVDGRGDVEVTVTARRGAAISGRVSYEDGSPAVSAMISLYRKRGAEFAPVTATQQADDRGVYRFAGLPPGEYVVAATELVVHGEGDAALARANMLLYTGADGGALFASYYPAATSIRKATPVPVDAGQERESVDLTIVERELHTLAGVVRTRAGRPLANARISIAASDGPSGRVYSVDLPDATTDAAGRFTLRELPDGDYLIGIQPTPDMDVSEVIAPQPTPKPAARPTPEDEGEEGEEGDYQAPLSRYAPKQQELKIAGRDIDNFEIVLSDGALVTGTVTIEGAKSSSEYVNVSASRVGAAGAGETLPGTFLRGQFAIGGLAAGRYFLRAGGTSEDGDYYVKSITYGGADLTREPLRVEDGAQIKGVRVVLAVGVATLQGRVVVSAGDHSPAAGAHVVAVPADEFKWPLPGAQDHSYTDAAGKFSTALAPGDYLVFVLPPGKPKELSDAELREYAARAKRVTLRAAQTTAVDLTAPGDK